MPCPSRHHTSEVADAWVKMDALCFIAIVIECYFDELSAKNDDCLIAVGMAVDGYDGSRHESIQYALSVVIRVAQVVVLTETRIYHRFVKQL